MNKKKKTWVNIIAGLILISVLVLVSPLNILQNNTQYKNKYNSESNYTGPPTYRFACIYSGISDDFKESLKKGLEQGEKDFNIWVSFHEFKSFEMDKHYGEIDKAILAKVDGIITNVPARDDIRGILEVAHEKDIPVILIEEDLPDSKRISFVGTNSYAFGVSAGKLMIEATGGLARTAIFKNVNGSKFDLRNQAFQHKIVDIKEMSTEVFTVKEPSIIEYTNMAQSIFLHNPNIDSFFCYDTESTLGIVRAMIEFNKTNNRVIGSGDSDEILKYIKSGIIYASLVEDPYSIGYLSIENMLNYKKGEIISESINPEIIVISKQNIDEILLERGGGD